MLRAFTRSFRERFRSMAVATVAVSMLVLGLLVAPPVAGASAEVVPAAVGPVKTANLANFQPGNIISDAAFFNSGTMSAAQIQAFIQSKNTRCTAGYTCLPSRYETTRTTAADPMCAAYQGGGSELASTIIFKVAQVCGINPQVLLVMLEKEQSLITHRSPSNERYRRAMGQGCPDTAACDVAYLGFFNQVYGAARQMKRYANPPGTSKFFTWYAPGRTWNVQFNPNAGCGSAPVYIQNQATANLYYYTPYQPNAAALRAGYGEGDGCSAYGNRNFYNFFNDWFGAAPVALPKIATLNDANYAIALDIGGGLWGYPTSPSGVFGAHVALASGLGNMTQILPVGDHDGDGHRDIIGIDAAKTAWLYRGDGARISANATRVPVDWSTARVIAAGGRFGGGSAPDVLTIDGNGRLSLWPSKIAGGFAAPRTLAEGFGSVDMLTAGMDMNGDGHPDIISRSTSGDLVLHTGNGAGGFLGSTWIGSGWSVMSSIFSPGDFTGDGRADVLAANAAGELVLYPNLGAGTIANGPVVGSGWQVMKQVSSAGAAIPGARAFPPGAGDVNGDGAADVLARTNAGALLLYQGDGSGGWRSQTTPVASWGSSKFATLGDFDGNGFPDLARWDANGDLMLLSGDGAGGYATPRWIGGGWNRFDLLVGGIDFDGDRKLDVLAREPSGLLYLYRGNGSGGWGNSTGQAVGTGWNVFDTVFNIGDFDGNGKAGLVGRRQDGSLWLYPLSGAGSWGAARQIGSGWTGIPSVFSPGNFDGVGGPDVLARMPNGDLRLYKSDGKGVWTDIVTVGTAWGSFAQIG